MTTQDNYTLLQKYPTQVPRYTSYPTAPHFKPMDVGTHREWLAEIPEDAPVSLYLHIPYCQKLCWFCGCHAKVAHGYDKVSTYLEALIKEIRLVRRQLKRNQRVAHIHFGGGSPTMLSGDDFSRIMRELNESFALDADAEIAIEIDPRTITEGKIAAYAKYGVNRVSIGVQDFDPAVQKAINRVQPLSTVYEALRLCRNYDIDAISLDLVYGLPLQTLQGFLDTVEYALALKPSRIALFGYAHVPWKKKQMQLINDADLPDDRTRMHLAQEAARRINAAGYVTIGLDHFAKPDDAMAIALERHTLRRNFQGYTTDTSEVLIGLGTSAISSFDQGYTQNAVKIEEYEQSLAEDKLATIRGIELTDDDKIRRAIIESLMCYYDADIALFDLDSTGIRSQLTPLIADGLASFSGTILQVNRDVPQACRLVCAAFDHYFNASAQRHGQVA